MKFLSATQVISLLPPTPAQVDEALLRFEDMPSQLFRETGAYKRAILEGMIQAQYVCVDGKPAHLFCYHKTDDGGLLVDMAQTVRKAGDPFALLAGVEMLARREGCRYLKFNTRRRGIAIEAQKYGFIPESVCLVKGLSA